MLSIAAIFLLASPLSLPQALQRTYTSKGRTIHYTVIGYKPPVQITPENGGLDQDTAINCVRLYWSRLKNLDIKGAAQLYLDPQHEIDARMKYKERVGDKVFREMHSKVFKSTTFTDELVIGTEHALVSETHGGTMMLLKLQNGKFFLESLDNAKSGHDAQDLMTLVNAHGDGKLKFQ
jgi:hypothetical protein